MTEPEKDPAKDLEDNPLSTYTDGPWYSDESVLVPEIHDRLVRDIEYVLPF